MDIDLVLKTMNQFQVDYLLLGGMNFMLRHKPMLTYDIDLWIEDSSENRHRCELALVDLNAEWGETTETWGPVSQLPSGWLERQAVFCLTSPHAAVDIMRFVEGMSDWQLSRMNCSPEKTKLGTPYFGLSDNDMLQCQLALIENQRNAERVRYLQNILKP